MIKAAIKASQVSCLEIGKANDNGKSAPCIKQLIKNINWELDISPLSSLI